MYDTGNGKVPYHTVGTFRTQVVLSTHIHRIFILIQIQSCWWIRIQIQGLDDEKLKNFTEDILKFKFMHDF